MTEHWFLTMYCKRLTRPAVLPALLIGVFLTAAQYGCKSVGRSSDSAGLLAHTDWPARITAGLERLAATVPPVLRSGADAGTASSVRVIHSERRGLGIVLELEETDAEISADSPRETELAFVSFSPLDREARSPDRRQTDLPHRITPADLHAGVRWHLYEPADGAACGLVAHLGGNKYVRRALLERGWAVLDAASTGRYVQRRANPVSFEISPGAKLEQAAAQIAALFDDELADWAYSLQAVLQYLAEHRPDLPQAPAAIMGFSIGAIALPAVVARMPERFEAAVLVAGGANLLEISHRTSKTDSGIELNWVAGQPSEADWRMLYQAYLDRARLDPYHTAAALANMPVLVYHGGFDRVVPAAAGELLFTRLGQAQRRVFPVGHGHLLRFVMRLQAGQVARWMEAALEAAPAPRTPGRR